MSSARRTQVRDDRKIQEARRRNALFLASPMEASFLQQHADECWAKRPVCCKCGLWEHNLPYRDVDGFSFQYSYCNACYQYWLTHNYTLPIHPMPSLVPSYHTSAYPYHLGFFATLAKRRKRSGSPAKRGRYQRREVIGKWLRRERRSGNGSNKNQKISSDDT